MILLRSILLFWLGTTTVLFAAVGYRSLQGLKEISALESRIGKEAERAAAERQQAEVRLVQIRQEWDAARNKLAGSEALLEVRNAALAPSSPRKSPALQKKLETDPDYQRFRRRDMRRVLLQLCGTVLGRANLPPEKLERLKQLLEERSQSVNDAMEITGNSGTQKISKLGVLAMKQTQTAVDVEIHALVGDALYHDIKYASSYRTQNSMVSDFEAVLADRGLSPLDSTQREALEAAYHAVHHPKTAGEEKNPVIEGKYGAEVDSQAETLVSRVFLPEQRDALARFHRDQQREYELYDRALHAVIDASKSSGG